MFKLFILTISTLLTLHLSANDLDLKEFSKIPIHSEGRFMPMDTMARHTLLTVYGKSTLKDNGEKISAIDWFAELLFTPQETSHINCFWLMTQKL